MSLRQERVQEQLVHELSEIIRKELRDPRIGFLTITGAEVSRDFRHAKVFFSVLGDEQARKDTLRGLQSATGLLRSEFAKRVNLRVAPELQFEYDDGISRGQRIFQLLDEVQDDLKPRPDDEEETTHTNGESRA
jgi:ribosome-binding factor A